MRIESSNRASKIKDKVGASRSSGAGAIFRPDMGQSAERANSVATNNPVAPVDALLALQGVEDPIFAKRKAFVRGETMLDILENMKTDLLAGNVNESHLNKLLATVQQARTKSDAKLDAIIDDIELRAKVELAKLGHFL